MFACDDDNKKLDLLEEIKSILFQLKFDLGTSSYVSAMCDLAIGYSELGRVNEVLEIEDSIKVDFDISNYFANNKTEIKRRYLQAKTEQGYDFELYVWNWNQYVLTNTNVERMG